VQYIPRRHQQIAAEFLATHNRCALFLDMGLGKTVITLTHLCNLLNDFSVFKCLVIAPKRVAEDTWSREAAKWDHLRHLRISRILGDRATRLAALEAEADIYVINRENVPWLVEQCGAKWDFDAVVIDELSSFKSAQAKRWRSLRRVIKLATHVIGLTGTPAPNGYMDLWPELFLIDGGAALGKTIGAYRQTYFYAGAHKGHVVYEWKLKRGSRERIDKKISPFCLSMSKDDWLQLPPILYNEVTVWMTVAERRSYDRFLRDSVLPLLLGEASTVDEMDSAIVGSTAATALGKLLQLANGACYDDAGGVFHLHDHKIEALEELVEAANGQPVLVFYSYKHDLARLQQAFPSGKVLDTSDDITAWNNGEIPILFCHPASAGHGLNLQEGGHIIVWFGLPWSLELYQQANARLHRQGQEVGVIVHHIICEDTVDSKVMAALRTKDATQRELLEALKGYVNEC